MPDVLHLKPEEIDTAEKRGKITVCVVGCGQTGLVYALMFSEAGFKVICTDADETLLKSLSRGKAGFSEREIEAKLKGYVRTGSLNATGDLKSAISRSDLIVVTNSAMVDEKGNLDFSDVESNCKLIGAALQRGALVVYAGLASLGFTDAVIRETMEGASGFKAGQDFALAYMNSQALGTEHSAEVVGDQELMLAANDKASLDAASMIMSTVTKKVRQIMNIKIAELTTLFEFARRNVSTALANEFAMFCEKAGTDIFEVVKFMRVGLRESVYTPTIKSDGEKFGTGLLVESAENLEAKLRIPELAMQINDDMVSHAVNLTQNILRDCGKTLRRGRIAVLGAKGQGTSGEAYVKMLESKGARINVYDPHTAKDEESAVLVVSKRSLIDTVENCDCIVFLTAEDQFRRLNLKSLRSLMKTPSGILDLVGLFEPERVKSEGLLYRGLGRGVERQ